MIFGLSPASVPGPLLPEELKIASTAPGPSTLRLEMAVVWRGGQSAGGSADAGKVRNWTLPAKRAENLELPGWDDRIIT